MEMAMDAFAIPVRHRQDWYGEDTSVGTSPSMTGQWMPSSDGPPDVFSSGNLRLSELLEDVLGWAPALPWRQGAGREIELGVSATGAAISVEIDEDLALADPLMPDRAIAEIQATLSLNVTEMAQALGVERATIYAWIARNAQPQRANLDRLNWLRHVAAMWSRHSPAPLGEMVRAPGRDGLSIVGLLSGESVPEGDLERRFEQAAHAHAIGVSRNPRIRSARDAADRHGIVVPRDAGQDEVDWLTRRGLGPED